MVIRGRRLDELKHITCIHISEYKERMKQIDTGHPVQYLENETMLDEYREKIDVLESLIEIIDNLEKQKEN